jgi:hypothetical protein
MARIALITESVCFALTLSTLAALIGLMLFGGGL